MLLPSPEVFIICPRNSRDYIQQLAIYSDECRCCTRIDMTDRMRQKYRKKGMDRIIPPLARSMQNGSSRLTAHQINTSLQAEPLNPDIKRALGDAEVTRGGGHVALVATDGGKDGLAFGTHQRSYGRSW